MKSLTSLNVVNDTTITMTLPNSLFTDNDRYYALLSYGTNLEQTTSPVRLLVENKFIFIIIIFVSILIYINSDNPQTQAGGVPGGAAWLVVAIILIVIMLTVSAVLVVLLVRWRNRTRLMKGFASKYGDGDIKEVC
jgi:hypothetical protein